jgi:pyrophosphatase PpaX
MPKAYLFDMDGTLVDTFHLIYESFNEALAENGKRRLTKAEFDRELFGKHIDSALYKLIGPITEKELAAIMKAFSAAWSKRLGEVKVFKSVPLTLQRLKAAGFKLGVVSTSPRDVIEKTLETTGISKYFDIIIGAEDAAEKKPHCEPVVHAFNALGMGPEEAVYVGDTIYDIQAGHSAGCYTVLLLNKYNKDVLESERPDRVVTDLSELLENERK